MSDDPTAGIAEQIENAAQALDTYERRLFPGEPISHRHGYEDSDVMLRSLLNDLQHYADYQGVDFDQVLAVARQIHADELAELRAVPLPGDVYTGFSDGTQVQLRADALLNEGRLGLPMRGIVVSSRPTTWGSDLCTVHFPGMNDPQEIAAPQLEPADAFTSIRLAGGQRITGVQEAEKQLTVIAVRMHLDRQQGLLTTTADAMDRAKLADALGAWVGTGAERVMACLRPEIAETGRRELLDPEYGTSEIIHPAQLAAEGFPRPPSDGGPANQARTGSTSSATAVPGKHL